jgi:hypothetical protein
VRGRGAEAIRGAERGTTTRPASASVGTGASLSATGGSGATASPAGGAGAGAGAADGAGAAGAATADGVGAGTSAGGAAGGAAVVVVVAAGSGERVGGADGRAGKRPRGSTYPSASEATRTPRWTYGCPTSASPLGPIVPTTAPSATASPFAGRIEPRWVRVTLYPSAVRIVSVRPLSATVPANVTCPAAGARTSAPGAAATSTPRC